MKTVKVKIFDDSTFDDIDAIFNTLSALYDKDVHDGGIILDVDIIERMGEPKTCKGYIERV